jgi:aspartyl-tRNA(Asn)/glutamyl-tRNA(Gln) amidotransferase subunit C
MVDIDPALTRQVANLARLALSDAEVQLFTPQLSQVLEYVRGLEKVNVEGIEPMTHPLELSTAFREDVSRVWPPSSEGRPAILDSAPESVSDGFKVPPVL